VSLTWFIDLFFFSCFFVVVSLNKMTVSKIFIHNQIKQIFNQIDGKA